MSDLLFTSVIAAGNVDWKASLLASHQPPIRELFVIRTNANFDVLDEWNEPSAHVLNQYSGAIGSGAAAVAHSVNYAYGHVRATMVRIGTDPCDGRTKTICTMLGLTGHVPKRNGRRGWPTFDEACDHFGVTRAGHESAEDNARCLAKIFQSMERAGIVPEPRIWRERNA